MSKSNEHIITTPYEKLGYWAACKDLPREVNKDWHINRQKQWLKGYDEAVDDFGLHLSEKV